MKLGEDSKVIKGLAWGLNIRLIAHGKSLLMSPRDFERMKKHLQKIAPKDFPPS